jgi:hypothetical protein
MSTKDLSLENPVNLNQDFIKTFEGFLSTALGETLTTKRSGKTYLFVQCCQHFIGIGITRLERVVIFSHLA